ncbi:MAG: M42 family metallopeptidase [Candidatus Nanohalobium sp.]
MKGLLKELVETPGVSGQESEIRDKIRGEVEEYADSVEVDNMGNLIVRKGGGDKTLMVAAHMDQIGLAVKRIDENGFIKFTFVGGVTLQSLMNQRVTIHTEEGKVTGVIGMKPLHLMDKDKREELPEKEQLFIDIGAEDDEEVEEAGVKVGDTVTFEREAAELRDDLVTGKSMDNRVGCLVGIEALKKYEGKEELAVVFSTQEEVGLKGAKTSTFRVEPDVALAVDVSIAGDVPGVEPDESELELGGGVDIQMIQSSGRGLITPETVRNWLIETAEEGDHEFSRGIIEGGATDAAGIELVKEGIPTGSVGVPLRNMHSATEVVKMADIKASVDFIVDAAENFPDYF